MRTVELGHKRVDAERESTDPERDNSAVRNDGRHAAWQLGEIGERTKVGVHGSLDAGRAEQATRCRRYQCEVLGKLAHDESSGARHEWMECLDRSTHVAIHVEKTLVGRAERRGRRARALGMVGRTRAKHEVQETTLELVRRGLVWHTRPCTHQICKIL